MKAEHILEDISRGRTDFIFHLLAQRDWRDLLHEGRIK